jgi:hypothetical protein
VATAAGGRGLRLLLAAPAIIRRVHGSWKRRSRTPPASTPRLSEIQPLFPRRKRKGGSRTHAHTKGGADKRASEAGAMCDGERLTEPAPCSLLLSLLLPPLLLLRLLRPAAGGCCCGPRRLQKRRSVCPTHTDPAGVRTKPASACWVWKVGQRMSPPNHLYKNTFHQSVPRPSLRRWAAPMSNAAGTLHHQKCPRGASTPPNSKSGCPISAQRRFRHTFKAPTTLSTKLPRRGSRFSTRGRRRKSKRPPPL